MINLLDPESEYMLGPLFLHDSKENWPKQPDILPLSSLDLGVRKSAINLSVVVEIDDRITKFSSWMKTLYVCA